MVPNTYIKSLLDNDLYKFTMQQAVLELYPGAQVEYVFTDRDDLSSWGHDFGLELTRQLDAMRGLRLEPEELMWLRKHCPYLKEWYLQYLKNYEFDPSEVSWSLIDQKLKIVIRGAWHKTILWEVPLLAIISEAYFNTMDTSWKTIQGVRKDFKARSAMKALSMERTGCSFADFGTRRRRSADFHRDLVETMAGNRAFMGTSNVALARHFGVSPIGTMAHEWIMGVSALRSLRHANRCALDDWVDVYRGRLGIALTDTYGLDAFLSDFNVKHAKLFDGVRHDSGSPLTFVSKVVNWYRKLGVNPMTKTAVFSDGLDVSMCQNLANICDDNIRFSFGIGTYLTNDFPDSPALNIVIKLRNVNGIDVVKLSDSPGKEMGSPSALAEAEYVFRGKQISAWEDC